MKRIDLFLRIDFKNNAVKIWNFENVIKNLNYFLIITNVKGK